MWKLFDWFSSSAKKAEQERRPMDAIEASNNSEASPSSGTVRPDPVLSTGSVKYIVSQSRAQTQAPKDAMAYWRRNTRRERPTDSQISSQFASSGHNWTPFRVDATATSARTRFDQTLSHDLGKLGSTLNDSTRAYFSNAYNQKNQAEVEAREDNDDYQQPALAAYPHYQGGWQPDRLPQEQSPEQQPELSLAQTPEQSPETPIFQPQYLSDTEAQQSATLDRMPATQIIEVRIAAADHPDTSREMLFSLARDTNPDVRYAIAENHNADLEILNLLSDDENPFVASRARKTMQRLAGGHCKQGNFSASRHSNRVRRFK